MNLGTRKCAQCHLTLVLKKQRDLVRKKFCSYGCRQKWRYKNGEWGMERLWQKSCTTEANAKKGHPGSLHPLWINDRSLVKNRPRYEGREWRKKVFERDEYTCQVCGVHGGKLQADHIKPYALYPELRWEILNGRTLCVPCHKKTETYGWRTRELKKRAA